MVIVAVVVIVAGGVVAVVLVRSDSLPPTFPASLVSSSPFPLYEPAWLPTGHFIDKQSLDATSQVVTFTINDERGKRLAVTEQPRPGQTSLDSFYSEQLSGSTTFATAAGQVTIGQFEGTTLVGIVTDRTWILVRAVSLIGPADIEQVARQFKQATP